MKKNLFFLVICFCLFSCNNIENDIDKDKSDISACLSERLLIVSNHSQILDQLKLNLSKPHALSDVTRPSTDEVISKDEQIAEIKKDFGDYIHKEHLDVYIKTEEDINIVLYPEEYIESIKRYFASNFIDDMVSVIYRCDNYNMLKSGLEDLLKVYKDDKHIDDYITIAAIALDSYSYWENEISRSRSWWLNLTRVVQGDALAAGGFILSSGCVALVTGATPPGALAIAGSAAFGSAVAAVNLIW